MSLAPALGWTLGVALLWLAGLPVAARLFPDFPDRGAALALPGSLAVFGLVVFWVGQVRYGVVAPVAGLLAALLAGVVAARAGSGVALRACLWRARGPVAVFVLTGGLMLAVRAFDPAVYPWGGEKFLDYGLVRVIWRADSLPPESIWFAGRPVRYYYGGQLLVAALARLTATPPRFAYNLALATFFGTLGTAAYGVAGAVVPARHRLAGGLGVVFAVLGGHLATPARALLGYLPREYAATLQPVWAGIRAPPPAAIETAREIAAGRFGYWPERHVVPGTPNAFPMWTYLNGDLRAHMLAGPFLLLAVGIALAYYRTPAERLGRRRALMFGAVPAVAGLLGTINTWDLPVALGVAWLALVHARGDPASLVPLVGGRADPAATTPDGGTAVADRGRERGILAPLRRASRALVEEGRRTVIAAIVAGVAGLLAVGVAWPVLANTPANEGIAPVVDRSGPFVLLLAYGGFLGAYLLSGLSVARPDPDARTALVLVGVPVALALSLADLAFAWVVVPFLVAGWVGLRRTRRGAGGTRFEAVLLVAGAGLVVVGELVYARVWPYDPRAPRWNTIYKLSMQVWLLWGVGAGAVLARAWDLVPRTAGDGGWLAPVARRARAAGPHSTRLRAGLREVRRRVALRGVVLRVGTALLVVGVATFPALAVVTHFEDPGRHPGAEPTLDAHTWARQDHPREMRAIQWLAAREGTPTVLTRPGRRVYTWRNAPSTFAGLPTVLGWYHLAGYRGTEAYRRRQADVRRIYEGDPATARRLLEQYGVDYVYVGPTERLAYRTWAVDEIPGLRPVYENEAVVIYAVEPYDGPLPEGDAPGGTDYPVGGDPTRRDGPAWSNESVPGR